MTGEQQAIERQLMATSASQSIWLSANAGSGKTRVLTDRVAMLLFGGTNPQNILCLTYTKAAATQMQNRLFARLGAWAMMPDEMLCGELGALGANGRIDAARLAHARTLFAAAIETPGGLRIQTIHSFCAALLRRFPLEAGISPLFRELDERNTRMIQDEVVDSLATGSEAEIVTEIAGILSDQDFENVATFVARNRDAFRAPMSQQYIRSMFGLGAEPELDGLVSRIFSEANKQAVANAVSVLRGGKPSDLKVADKLAASNFLLPGAADLAALFGLFLYSKGSERGAEFTAMIGTFATTDLQCANAAVFDALEPMMQLTEQARKIDIAEKAAERSWVFRKFATAYLREYDRLKTASGVLDFDDLIEKAEALLSDRLVAAWVMFKLDGGIDHILVDEAQDTSPAQWRVIKCLAQDFGHEADAARQRTIFAVGDKKQSIYSFQGADPREFDSAREYFAAQYEHTGQRLRGLELLHSFRSSPAILRVVDTVFENTTGGFENASHRAAYDAKPGRVDLWPVVPKAEAPQMPRWFDPATPKRDAGETAILAGKIACRIKAMIGRDQLGDANGQTRPVHAGDFVVLVQRRKDLFHEIIKACKKLDMPIAGADRLQIGGELAVNDLRALLSFLALPQDDLSLASALRSPLFRFSEQELFSLAHDRGEDNLWSALYARQDSHPETVAELMDLRNHADFLPPFELLERVLTVWGGRIALLERLGREAEEGIDEFLNLARDYETIAPASLTGFLAWLERDKTEIKRQPDSAGRQIRVMTTHGAKGQEASIVILPETLIPQNNPKTGPRIDESGRPFWATPKIEATDLQAKATEAETKRAEEERLRLFYVAMTRAERWLIICGTGDGAAKEGSWHSRARRALEALGAQPLETPTGTGLRYETGDWPERCQDVGPGATDAQVAALPDWATRVAKRPAREMPLLRPSDLPGDKTLPGEATGEGDLAARKGSAVHKLLEHAGLFRVGEFAAHAHAVLANSGMSLGADAQAEVIAQVSHILGQPEFRFLFGDGSMAEVAVSVPVSVPGHDRLHGTIDRLVLSKGRALIVDFKSNFVVPDRPEQVPDGLILQLAAYAQAVSLIYPDRVIEAAILWTSAPKLMALPHKLVNHAWDALALS